jgi:hypothetical protein
MALIDTIVKKTIPVKSSDDLKATDMADNHRSKPSQMRLRFSWVRSDGALLFELAPADYRPARGHSNRFCHHVIHQLPIPETL